MLPILLAEDDKNTRLLTTLRLKPYYEVTAVADGQEALDYLRSGKEAALLVADVMMPRLDGFELVKQLRQDGNSIPVIMLTAKQQISDKRTGFALGIDDYLTKPVNYEELVMRIDAVLRRSRITNEKKIVIGSVELNASSYTVTRKNADGTEERIELPKKEFDLLYKLLSYPGEIFTKTQLFESVWGLDSESNEDTVKVHVNRLRSRFDGWKEFSIETLRGLGYRACVSKGN